jgi:hypothetical protein
MRNCNPAAARDGSERVELTANQIADQFGARTARMKADLRLTPEQDKSWSGFENAMTDIGRARADRQIAQRSDRVQQKGPIDAIEQMRKEAAFMSERATDQKRLADAAEPLYVSLNDQQKRRFGEQLFEPRSGI